MIFFKPNSEFAPSQISGNKLWIAGDNLALNDNDVIVSIPDKSGNNNTLTQSDVTKRPILKTNLLNGKPAIRFDGNSDAVILTNSINLNNSTGFIVVNTKGFGTQAFISGVSGGGLMWRYNNQRSELVHSFVAVIGQSNTNLPINTNLLLAYDISNGVGGVANFYNQDTFQGSVATNRNMNNSNQIGAEGLGQYLNADLFEFILYDRVLSVGERTQVINFLKLKYNL